MTEHLAQLNVGRLAHDIDDPAVADFVAGREMIDRIAASAPGFVWKPERGFGDQEAERMGDDPRLLYSLSVWESAEALVHFVWRTLHKRFVQRRAEWFAPPGMAHLALWWVPVGHRPSLTEATDRLHHLREHGESNHAFGWARLAAITGAPEFRSIA